MAKYSNRNLDWVRLRRMQTRKITNPQRAGFVIMPTPPPTEEEKIRHMHSHRRGMVALKALLSGAGD